MSVYTPISPEEMNHFLADFDCGHLVRLEEIQDGVVNSNYRVDTTQGNFVLTLTEDPDQGQGLPFTTALMSHLSQKNIPCPRPVANRRGEMVGQLKGRPVLLACCLPGVSPTTPTPQQCRLVGEMLAQLHLAARDFSQTRPNPMGPEILERLLERLIPVYANPPLLNLLQEEMLYLLSQPYPDLPQGICHTDLFPDNSLFQGDHLTGVIDFHYASHDRFIHDFAILLNAWGFHAGRPAPDRLRALWHGYTLYRPLTGEERVCLHAALRGAALRFALTRLTDHLFPRSGLRVTRKPPEEYLDRLRFYKQKGWEELFSEITCLDFSST